MYGCAFSVNVDTSASVAEATVHAIAARIHLLHLQQSAYTVVNRTNTFTRVNAHARIHNSNFVFKLSSFFNSFFLLQPSS